MPFDRDDDFSELEAELRRDRPVPEPELLERLISRVEHEPSPTRTRSLRLGLGAGFATVFLAVFAGFGGLGYAKDGVATAGHATGKTLGGLFTAGHQSGQSGDSQGADDDSAHNQYPDFMLVCLILPHDRDVPVVVPRFVAERWLARDKAHLPPCHGNGGHGHDDD